jgi:TonB-dependent starch-binding outer membrane protein SusC
MKWTSVVCLLALAILAGPLQAQTETGRIIGTVTDAQTAQPLSGVNISIPGTARGTLSGANGQFVLLNVPVGSHSVRAALIGYAARELGVTVRAGEAANVSFQLDPQAVQLQEVVAVGYGTVRRGDVTGAVASVNMDAVERAPVVSVDQMLQGTAPGVQVTQASSEPGGGVSIRVRGGTSVSENVSNEPLYVIDGFPIEVDYAADNNRLGGGRAAGTFVPTNPLATLNPRDIESIEILKDASATAIYGARAANGVVIITTRRGQAGAPRVNFEASSGIQSVAKRYDLLTGPEFAQFANEWASTQVGMEPIFANPGAVPTTDWQNEIFRRAPIQNYQLSVTGGTSGENATRYAVSGGYFNQDGVVMGSTFERLSLRLNLNQEIGERFRLGTTLSGSRVTTSFVPTSGGIGGNEGSAVAAALQFIPAIPVRREDGTFTQMDNPLDVPPGLTTSDINNPVAVLQHMDDQLGDTRVLSNSFGEIDIVEGLRFRTSLGANLTMRQRDTYWPRETRRGQQVGGQAIRGQNESTSVLNENTLSFNRSFGAAHSVNAVVGYTRQVQESSSTQMTNENFLDDILGYHDIGAGGRLGGPVVSSGASRTTMASYLGRVNYNLLDRYLLTFTGRRDGSSRFGPGRQWGFFPSGAIAWRVSHEPFIRNLEIGALSDLKLRASYGATGNAGVSPYQSLATLGSRDVAFGSDIVTVFRQTRLPNEQLGWETTYQFDAGVDVGLMNNMFTVVADYYNRRTVDLLMQVELPYETGFRQAFQNAGEVRNRGFELSLGVNTLRGDGFDTPRWSNSFNYSRNRNLVLDLGGVDILPVRGISTHFGFPGTNVRVGYPIGVFFGYQSDGIFRDSAEAANYGATLPNREFQAGETRIVDINGDGVINDLDLTFIGDPNPDFNLGWTSTFGWRGFELSTLLQGAFGADVLNINLIRVEGGTPSTNITRQRFDGRWTPENPDASYPRIGVFEPGRIGGNFVDTALEDGSYVRLSTATLSYTIPGRWVARYGLRDARVYINGSNLYTWTRYSGYNPDVSGMGVSNLNRGVDVGAYPLARSVSIGVNVGY